MVGESAQCADECETCLHQASCRAQHGLTGARGIASVQSLPYPSSQTSSQCVVMRTATENRIMARKAKKVATRRRAALSVHPGSSS